MAGRLPSIQSIGKSFSVDLEEPPDFSSEESFTKEDDFNKLQRYFFELGHTESCAEALERTFTERNPGGHMCQKLNLENPAGFIHCHHAVNIAKSSSVIKHLMQNRAKLQLVRDYASRISTATMFVQDLEHITRQEFATWYAICHNCLQEAPTTKLEYLSVICEDLRINMNHWNSIKQMVHTNKWLKPMIPRLCLELDIICQKLCHLRDLAIWWTDQLIRLGLQVLAHCDLERFTRDSIWAITRGLEDFNVIVSAIRMEMQHESSASSHTVIKSFQNHNLLKKSYPPFPLASHANSFSCMGENIKAISFGRVLNILASERSKYAAAMTHRFYTSSEAFLQLVNSGRLPGFSWEDVIREHSQLTPHGTDTSDYASASGSHISLSAAMLRVGDLLAPDLSQEMSPVIDFAQHEQEFVSKFLQIVCDSTKMLKRPSVTSCSPISSTKLKNRPPSGASAALRKARFSSDSDISVSSSFSDPKRKSVSWGDAVNSSVVQQLTTKYMDMLWQTFGYNLTEFFLEHVWGGFDETQPLLGHISMCDTVAVMMIVKMVEQTCVKDLFSSGAVLSLQGLATRLQVATAWADWDQDISSSLAAAVTDKCQPVPLVHDTYSTKTGKLSRDAFQPLVCLLVTFHQHWEDGVTKGANGVITSRNPNLALMYLTMQRLLFTCQVANKWCSTKTYHHLSGWVVGSFLLVTHSDLKLLADEMTRALTFAKPLCNGIYHGRSTKESQMHQSLCNLWLQMNSVHSSLQTLSGAAVKMFSNQCQQMSKEYFQESMPQSKLWRKKYSQDLPREPSEYAESAMGTLLEPIVSGVSKLKPASQIGVISVAVTSICDAWTSHILQEKIKFSLYGAYQLQLDFGHMQSWLQQKLAHCKVRQSVMSLDVFKNLMGIVELLKQQPRGRLHSRTRNASRREESSCDIGLRNNNDRRYSLETETTPASGSEFGSEGELDGAITLDTLPRDHNTFKVPNMEQWLALRLHGGSKSWRIPSCFNPTDIEV